MSQPLRARLALTAATIALGLAFGCGPTERRIQVIYYFQAGSEGAARATPLLKALEGEFPGRVVVKTIDATSPDAKRDLTRLGFPSHGLVVRDARGVMLFKSSGDDFDIEEIRSTVRQAGGAS
jgi:hypothetical protein